MKRLEKIVIETVDENDPDLSYLGEYSNTAKSPDAIDRQANGDQGRNEYRYFNPGMTGEETGNPDSPQQDYARFEAYNRGEWRCVGIRAKAHIQTSTDGRHWVSNTVTSPGVYGVESDSGDDYLRGIGADELSELRNILGQLGFTDEEIDRAPVGFDI